MAVNGKKLDEDVFLEQRKQVLGMWKTGAEVDIDEAIAYHKAMPAHKNITNQMQAARKNGRTIIYNLSGYSTLVQQKDLLLTLQNEGGSGFLICIYDSYTRTCRFEQADAARLESERSGKNLLNGFPVVSYGVKGCRELFESVDRPVASLGPSIENRLCTEIALASGFSQMTINSFTVFESYTKTVPLEDIIACHQYSARLVGYYQDKGVNIAVVAPNGAGGDNAPGTAPTSIGSSGNILGALLCAAQGVKHIVLEYHAHGNLAQDVATCLVRMELAREYLDRLGYNDVEIYLENGQMGGMYPLDFDQAFVQVVYGASFAALAPAERCQVKTFDESSSIPTKENQVRSLVGAKMMYDIFRCQNIDFYHIREVQEEANEERLETRAIVDKVLEFGDGDVVLGAIKAYELGIMDNPVASNPRVKTFTMGMKDTSGAVRYLNPGNLPLTKDMVDFHREKLAAREKSIGHKLDFDTIVSDMRALTDGTWLTGLYGR